MKPITVTATTAAGPERAMACFTDPSEVTRWNFATEAWFCPGASSDLRPGGVFSYEMAARDGSMRFAYAGTWEVVEAQRLVQVLEDGRRVEITFTATESGTQVTEVFDPDPNAPRALQQAGWQSILHRFADVAGGQPPITIKQLEARPMVGIRRQVPTAELGAFFSEALPEVMRWLGAKGIQPASPPMAMWCAMDIEAGVADCHAGCFVANRVEGDSKVTAGATAAGDVLTVTHTGPYNTVGRSWMAVYRRASELARTPGAGWEIYVDDPAETPAESLRTEIYLPVSGR